MPYDQIAEAQPLVQFAYEDVPMSDSERSLGEVGLRALDFVFEKLHIDREWSVREARSFTWWPHRLAQRVWVDTWNADESGAQICLHAETDVLTGVPDNAMTRTRLLAFNALASLSAWVWHPETGRVSLHSTVYVTAEAFDWSLPLFLGAASIQAADAHIKAPVAAELLGGQVAESFHPAAGPRPEPDEMLNVLETVFVPAGKGPSPFTSTDFEAVSRISPRPWVLATANGGLAAEYPFDDDAKPALLGGNTALLLASAAEPHPQLGNGLFMRLILPIIVPSASDNTTDLATSLNEAETREFTRAYLLGAWCVAPRDNRLTFVSFFPAALYRPGLINVLAWSTGARVRWAKQYLVQHKLYGSPLATETPTIESATQSPQAADGPAGAKETRVQYEVRCQQCGFHELVDNETAMWEKAQEHARRMRDDVAIIAGGLRRRGHVLIASGRGTSLVTYRGESFGGYEIQPGDHLGEYLSRVNQQDATAVAPVRNRSISRSPNRLAIPAWWTIAILVMLGIVGLAVFWR